MTLADRIETVLLEQGPLPVCSIAPAVRKQKADVIAVLNDNPDRFVHNGQKARASRWDVRCEGADAGFDTRAAAAHFGCSVELAATFLERFEELGYVARVNGNGRFRVTEKGLRTSHAMHGVEA